MRCESVAAAAGHKHCANLAENKWVYDKPDETPYLRLCDSCDVRMDRFLTDNGWKRMVSHESNREMPAIAIPFDATERAYILGALDAAIEEAHEKAIQAYATDDDNSGNIHHSNEVAMIAIRYRILEVHNGSL